MRPQGLPKRFLRSPFFLQKSVMSQQEVADRNRVRGSVIYRPARAARRRRISRNKGTAARLAENPGRRQLFLWSCCWPQSNGQYWMLIECSTGSGCLKPKLRVAELWRRKTKIFFDRRWGKVVKHRSQIGKVVI